MDVDFMVSDSLEVRRPLDACKLKRPLIFFRRLSGPSSNFRRQSKKPLWPWTRCSTLPSMTTPVGVLANGISFRNAQSRNIAAIEGEGEDSGDEEAPDQGERDDDDEDKDDDEDETDPNSPVSPHLLSHNDRTM